MEKAKNAGLYSAVSPVYLSSPAEAAQQKRLI